VQFGELKLNPITLNGSQKMSTSWIDLKILPHKLKKRAKIYQQILLNMKIGCKN